MSGYLFGRLANQTRMKKTALSAARMVLVRQQSVTRVARALGVKQPLVSRAVARIILEAHKDLLRKNLTVGALARAQDQREVPSRLAQYETTFEEVKAGMGEGASLEFVLDIKLRDKTKDGSALSLLRFTPVLKGEPLPTQKFLLEASKAVVKEVMREHDFLVQIDHNFFVIADNVTRRISDMIIARYRDKFRQKLNLEIKAGLSIFDPSSFGLSANKMIAQALTD
ncbi:MAG: hypothetical protein ACD_74C00155G0014 [uncultured bacterium]|nr:MAG: hypothetical protein ACD_74C00155G0014 [uncultured bacterium]